ncbi:hypothetical protein [Lactiplantibacillus paraxiangfangensis]|uniref:hypothetical protein n=1 Tax=Lactiplantibacillus paraxiangfangensis TaxID=3076224 RepID=UPI0030C6E380
MNNSMMKNDKKWNVIIGIDSNDLDNDVVAYCKYQNGSAGRSYFVDDTVSKGELAYENFQFTDEEFNDLLSVLKRQPYGEKLAKIAELGKREVKDDANIQQKNH